MPSARVFSFLRLLSRSRPGPCLSTGVDGAGGAWQREEVPDARGGWGWGGGGLASKVGEENVELGLGLPVGEGGDGEVASGVGCRADALGDEGARAPLTAPARV